MKLLNVSVGGILGEGLDRKHMEIRQISDSSTSIRVIRVVDYLTMARSHQAMNRVASDRTSPFPIKFDQLVSFTFAWARHKLNMSAGEMSAHRRFPYCEDKNTAWARARTHRLNDESLMVYVSTRPVGFTDIHRPLRDAILERSIGSPSLVHPCQ